MATFLLQQNDVSSHVFPNPRQVRILRDLGQGVRTPPPPPGKSQNIGFFSNSGPYAIKNLKATKPAVNVGP